MPTSALSWDEFKAFHDAHVSQGNERRLKMEENDCKRRSRFLSARGDNKYNIPLILTAFIHLCDISIYNYILMPSIICLDMKLKFKHISFFQKQPSPRNEVCAWTS